MTPRWIQCLIILQRKDNTTMFDYLTDEDEIVLIAEALRSLLDTTKDEAKRKQINDSLESIHNQTLWLRSAD